MVGYLIVLVILVLVYFNQELLTVLPRWAVILGIIIVVGVLISIIRSRRDVHVT